MNFDGDINYITVPDSSDWDFVSQDFTIEFWHQFKLSLWQRINIWFYYNIWIKITRQQNKGKFIIRWKDNK